MENFNNKAVGSIGRKRCINERAEKDQKRSKIPRMEFNPSSSLEQKLEYVLDHCGDMPTVLFAAQFGDVELFEQLVKQGENANLTDEEGNGVLHYASLNKTFGKQIVYYFKHSMKSPFNPVVTGLVSLRLRFGKKASLFKENGTLNTDLLAQAAAFSDLKTFKWLYESAKILNRKFVCSKEWQLLILQTAFVNSSHGVKIAQFMMESSDCNVTIEDFTFIIASTQKAGFPFLNRDVLAIFHSRGIDLKPFFQTCLSKNFIDTAKFLHSLKPQEIDSATFCYAAWGSDVEMIEWLRELNPALELTPYFFFAASQNAKYGRQIIDYFAAKLNVNVNAVNKESSNSSPSGRGLVEP